MPKILIIEDEAAIRRVLAKILTEENKNYEIDEAIDGLEGIEKIKKEDYDLILCDIKMPKSDGMEVLESAKKIKPEIPIVMISGHGDLETAVNTMRLGAYDYISKPPDLNRLLNTVRNALDRKELVVENKRLKKKIGKNYQMIGQSPALEQIRQIIQKVAPTEARVLITGSNGTGKELVAHALHNQSERADAPMIEVNCAAIPSELIESELFGHIKGAFTSAVKDRAGKFEAANKGTIFLDEIGDMSLSAQAKVLRALQENKIARVGSDKDIEVDVRVVAATNKDLKKEIAEGRFREDLYHRLAVILIKVPALNERREDIPLLIEHFSKKIAEEQGISPKKFSDKAIKLLQQYDWTGNIRELRNVTERLIILGGKEISEDDVKAFAGK
ncbi:sigma-54-dependent transcriptional regulator [Capnocytophaga canimorsus]|uniref:Transcriptional regulatory protein zraR n=3 Tax=Capnocytophaga canimorsus TaxID=28188 RepID=F9YTV3_CAPCC|nr:sigma-54 dependent transcriptional regulator [Capnocytophaga canimorsus]AEK22887.1 Transcriptional regulatory protein zraR [Capnocytophaga canimorsus Cc5]ATA77945.1 sigma-54-dependent Fis family transcriptional regulator [Capnocytophaga canimorsus]ATA92647.1 sigma-54-dependent Fis family transcriptional regulator [Capnocytophaga canimorsus]ATA94741.1 sigma-54-dependent Fis family transcriptional regulator [Capnocytophaga canimorsus]AWL79442.1 sigma-54-dependent Fis family transcriptional re